MCTGLKRYLFCSMAPWLAKACKSQSHLSGHSPQGTFLRPIENGQSSYWQTSLSHKDSLKENINSCCMNVCTWREEARNCTSGRQQCQEAAWLFQNKPIDATKKKRKRTGKIDAPPTGRHLAPRRIALGAAGSASVALTFCRTKDCISAKILIPRSDGRSH